jgi:TonB family protein
MRHASWLAGAGLLATVVAAAADVRAERPVVGSIVSLAMADYKTQWRDAGITGSVTIEATISADGSAEGIRVLSPPSVLDRAAVEAVGLSLFEPPICTADPAPDHYEAHLDIVFSRDGDRFFVGVSNARYTAAGDPPSAPSKSRPPLKQVAGENPRYPHRAFSASLQRALVIAALRVKEDGAVDVIRIFSVPKKFFEDETRSALEDWRFEPPVDGDRKPSAVIGCVRVKYLARDPD